MSNEVIKSKELLHYLGHILECHKQLLILEKTYKNYSVKVKEIEDKKRNFDKPVKEKGDTILFVIVKTIAYIMGFFMGLSLLNYIIGSIVSIFKSDNWFIFKIFGLSIEPIVNHYIILGVSILLSILIAKTEYTSKENAEKINREAETEYQKKIEKEELRIIEEKEKKQAIWEVLDGFGNQYDKVKNTLKQLYDMNIIYASYQNIVAVATIYQYLESGRCYALEGHEGAYNLYESELRQNIIIQKLDIIIDDLERIQRNQRILYSTLQEANQKISYLTNVNEIIMENSEIAAYNSYVTVQNTTTMKWMEMLRR